MVTTIAKRIQSRLSRQGVKVSLGEIRPIYKELVKDTNKPTDEEISAIVEHFMNNATKLSVISEELEIDTTATTEEEPETATTGEELATVDSNVNDVTQLPIIEDDTSNEELETLTQFNNEEVEETAIALQEKSELVASTANDMGITLSIEEVTAIAENFDYASVNSDYEIAEIESAITAFVQHKAQVTKQKISNMVQGVRETVTRLDHENSQLLNDGLREINNDIKRGTGRFKSQVSTALKAFALPPSKTG
ncbi:hypothetical protein [Nostoc sp. UHCC 0870]|uniref:hypothetical protein n=1 Tax=Nostoc sp. UHCC 0870 TaxID=2914041 RepID=UPI001EE081E2|nr:hypothetical protein [Nostoc sp. UHCC 0870]UKP01406.1 hypothetical protein L6494_29665 [Nostoc sp. UHCC 0870]